MLNLLLIVDKLWKAIEAMHYAYPSLMLLYFVVASLASICLSTTPRLRVKDQNVRRDIILWLILLATLGYVSTLRDIGIPRARIKLAEFWTAVESEITS